MVKFILKLMMFFIKNKIWLIINAINEAVKRQKNIPSIPTKVPIAPKSFTSPIPIASVFKINLPIIPINNNIELPTKKPFIDKINESKLISHPCNFGNM